MLDIADLDINNKKILELGTGNGGTTLEILDHMQAFPTSQLVTVDVIPVDFTAIISQYPDLSDRTKFLQADLPDLPHKLPFSPDLVIIHYTLCAINAKSGRFLEALSILQQIAAPNALFLIEEEFPLNHITQNSPKAAHLWAEQWRIIKALVQLSHESPYQEIYPEYLSKALELLNFDRIQVDHGSNILHEREVLPYFQARFSYYYTKILDRSVKRALHRKYTQFKKILSQESRIEIPIYQITAIRK